MSIMVHNQDEIFNTENREWLEPPEYLIENEQPERLREEFGLLQNPASKEGIHFSYPGNTQHILSIHTHPTASETLIETSKAYCGQSVHLYNPKK